MPDILVSIPGWILSESIIFSMASYYFFDKAKSGIENISVKVNTPDGKYRILWTIHPDALSEVPEVWLHGRVQVDPPETPQYSVTLQSKHF